jgi:hypothetical protein
MLVTAQSMLAPPTPARMQGMLAPPTPARMQGMLARSRTLGTAVLATVVTVVTAVVEATSRSPGRLLTIRPN